MNSDLSDEELRVNALDILNKHLGPAKTIRFLSWLRSTPRSYQAWRDAHFRGFTANDLIERMRAIEAEPA
ncbi:MAG TPA: hypothetical protein VNT79_03610 [Phycisphaerae bacterium]|nr:hypothetical protein [Phycisphaerae bacterium]